MLDWWCHPNKAKQEEESPGKGRKNKGVSFTLKLVHLDTKAILNGFFMDNEPFITGGPL
jgi:hypothetical protein